MSLNIQAEGEVRRESAEGLSWRYLKPLLLVLLSFASPILTPLVQKTVPGPISAWDLGNMVLIIAFGCVALNAGRIRVPPWQFTAGLLAIVFARFASLGNAQFFQAANVFSAFRYVEVLGVVTLWINLLPEQEAPKLVVSLALILTFLETAVGLLGVVASHGQLRAYASGLGAMQVFSIMYLLLAGSGKNIWNWVGAVFLFVGITMSLTRGEWITFGVASFILFLTSPGAFRSRALAGTICFVMIALTVYGLWPQMQQRVAQIFSGGGTIGVRLVLWSLAIAGFTQHPLLGMGTGTFARQYDYLLQISGQSLPQVYWGLSTHNEFLEAAVETGTFGIAAYLIYLGCMAALLLPAVRGAYRRQDHAMIRASAITLSALSLSDFYAQGSFSVPYTVLCVIFFLGLGKSRYGRQRLFCRKSPEKSGR